MLDDATPVRPSWNNDIAHDFLRHAVALLFSNTAAAEKWRENLYFSIYLVLGKIAGKSRITIIIVIQFIPGGVRYAAKPTK